MEHATPFVTIIIPCRNEKKFIESCVRSILSQQSPPGGFELIIADGMSDDGTRTILNKLAEEDSRLHVIDNPGRIVSTGLNSGIRVAQGKVIVRMDAHTEYASDYLRQCVTILQETAAENVGGPWVAKGKGLMGEAIAAAFQSPFGGGGARAHNPDYEGRVDTAYLGCWPREVFDRIGLFDEELVRNQDDEFNLRLTRAGGKIWQSPRIKSWYSPRRNLGALFKQYMQYGYWKVRVIQKHKLPASIRHLIPGGFVAMLVSLPLLSIRWEFAGLAWMGLGATYLVADLTASYLVAGRKGWKLFPLLPLVFFIYHLGYGFGFLRGVWDFVVLRRGPNDSCTDLTRHSENH
jgi:glycosyltransferase involved in cell wall biosynthesis